MTITLLVPDITKMYDFQADWSKQMDRRKFNSDIEKLGYEVGFHSVYGRRAVRIEAALTNVPMDLVAAGLEFISFEMVRANAPVTLASQGTYEGGSVEHEHGVTAHVETNVKNGVRCQTIRVTGSDLTAVALYFESLIAGTRNDDCILAVPDHPDYVTADGLHLSPGDLSILRWNLAELRPDITSDPRARVMWRNVYEILGMDTTT